MANAERYLVLTESGPVFCCNWSVVLRRHLVSDWLMVALFKIKVYINILNLPSVLSAWQKTLFSFKLPLYKHAYMSTVHLITFWHFLLDAKHVKCSYKNRCRTV